MHPSSCDCERCYVNRLEKELEAAKIKINAFESKHPEWMKRIQRERMEERERCACIVEDGYSLLDPVRRQIAADIRRA